MKKLSVDDLNALLDSLHSRRNFMKLLGKMVGCSSLASTLSACGGGESHGGQIISDWPGLVPANLEMCKDQGITTDLRTVLTERLDKRLGDMDMNAVFPGFGGPASANVYL